MSAPRKAHPYKGRHLTVAELLAQPECLPELDAVNVRVRIWQGMPAELAITVPLRDRRQRNRAEELKIKTAAQVARDKLKAIMSAPVKPTSTSAYYAIGAIEARLQLAQITSNYR